MQTKSVLTVLSLAILCSSTAFSMGPRLGRIFTKQFFAGTALGASPFIAYEIHNQREGEKLRGKREIDRFVEKAKIEFDFEVWEAKELGMLSNDYLKELEDLKKKTIMETLYKDWQKKTATVSNHAIV